MFNLKGNNEMRTEINIKNFDIANFQVEGVKNIEYRVVALEGSPDEIEFEKDVLQLFLTRIDDGIKVEMPALGIEDNFSLIEGDECFTLRLILETYSPAFVDACEFFVMNFHRPVSGLVRVINAYAKVSPCVFYYRIPEDTDKGERYRIMLNVELYLVYCPDTHEIKVLKNRGGLVSNDLLSERDYSQWPKLVKEPTTESERLQEVTFKIEDGEGVKELNYNDFNKAVNEHSVFYQNPYREDYCGYILEVRAVEERGHLCGYIEGIRDEVAPLLDKHIHGGWTFSTVTDKEMFNYIPEREEIMETTDKDDMLKIGFDCAHSSDISHYLLKEPMIPTKDASYKTLGFVLKELKRVIDEHLENTNIIM